MKRHWSGIFVVATAVVGRVEAQVTWQEVPLQAPQSRSLHAMAADDVRGNVVLFGGADGATGCSDVRTSRRYGGCLTSEAGTLICRQPGRSPAASAARPSGSRPAAG